MAHAKWAATALSAAGPHVHGEAGRRRAWDSHVCNLHVSTFNLVHFAVSITTDTIQARLERTGARVHESVQKVVRGARGCAHGRPAASRHSCDARLALRPFSGQADFFRAGHLWVVGHARRTNGVGMHSLLEKQRVRWKPKQRPWFSGLGIAMQPAGCGRRRPRHVSVQVQPWPWLTDSHRSCA